MMENKKLSNGQLQKRIKNALVFVPRDKDYKCVFFDDKMIRLEVTEDFCVISTGYHQHVFQAHNYNNTDNGYSRPYLYTRRVVECALENDCKHDNGTYTYEHFLDVLKQKKDKSDYNVALYYSWWLFNIFAPLYQIGENMVETFTTYEAYMHNIARSSILLSEKTEDMTNKQFVNNIMDKEKTFLDGVDEYVLFPKMTDEDLQKKEMEAIQEVETNNVMEAQVDGVK